MMSVAWTTFVDKQ